MSLSILVDMNLSVEWVPRLVAEGYPSVHWSQVGDQDWTAPATLPCQSATVVPANVHTSSFVVGASAGI